MKRGEVKCIDHGANVVNDEKEIVCVYLTSIYKRRLRYLSTLLYLSFDDGQMLIDSLLVIDFRMEMHVYHPRERVDFGQDHQFLLVVDITFDVAL